MPDSSGAVEKRNIVCKGKLVVVGDIAVGKTSLVQSLCTGQFNRNQRSSIGVAYSTKTISVDESTTVKLDVWDTAGQERFRSIGSLFIRDAGAAVIVYDITCKSSFVNVKEYWLDQLRSYAVPQMIVALAGNKADLKSKRQVSKEDADAFAEKEGLIHLECSAKTGLNVQDIFRAIAAKVPEVVGSSELAGPGFKVVSLASSGSGSKLRLSVEKSAANSSGCGC